ncbi:c-type cytochrome [Frateuria soli]|uniref:c-type cytochrome n=1 Tax=Frateuria soli TaxID=1542730 RepID=UPI001E60CAE6|nr:c-type cytochrome [Frateuria soli]UGB39551.1 c-type cytochrome [Frateuria soli]
MPAHRYRVLLSWSVVLLLATIATGARATDPATIASQGNGRGAAPCQSCHGADGAGQAAGGFPRLAGLNAAYLRRQLDAFATGTRANPVMKPIATALSVDERQAMADYYSKLPVPPQTAATAPAQDGVGAMLALRGRWSDQVPACVQCHGPGGAGVGEHFPPLVGQPASYLAAQLKAFRQGTRHNDPLELMRHLGKALDENDMQAVAEWFAAQPFPATPKESTR